MSRAVAARPAPVQLDRTASTPRTGRLRRWFTDPWRPPRFLLLFTILYLLWSLLPVVVAMLFSFNSGRSRTTWQGFSMRWYWGDPDLSVAHDPTLRGALGQSLKLSALTMLIAVPLGAAFAVATDRWRGRGRGGANFLMMFSFLTPEIVTAVSLFLLFTSVVTMIGLGTRAQLLGLVTLQLAYPVIIVRARLLSIGKEYEEAAMDLGASPREAVRRVLLPLLWPAILASFAIVFATTIDDFVLVRALSSDQSTETIPILIYTHARGGTLPSLNALATIMVLSTLVTAGVGFLVYRWLTRAEGSKRDVAVKDFAAAV